MIIGEEYSYAHRGTGSIATPQHPSVSRSAEFSIRIKQKI